jgi:RNA polymerase sigma-70 factor (ECF subfamily)
MSAPGFRARSQDADDLTHRLREWVVGRGAHGDANLDALVGELASIAARIMQRQPPGHTLQATALLNEFWLKISQSESNQFENRHHFLGTAVTTMRRIVVDHAKARAADKRCAGGARVELERVVTVLEDKSGLDLVELDDALQALGAQDADALRVVELRFFGGLTAEETAEVLGWTAHRVRSEEVLARKRLARLLA